jgi:hypothetical protein
MALSNVALTDTFDVWRTRTNQIIVLVEGIENSVVNRVDDTSTTNIAAASAVKTTYDYATLVGTSGNAFTTLVGTSGNAFTTLVGSSANAYATLVGTSGNAFTTLVGSSANARANVVGSSANAYATVIVGAAFNQANLAPGISNTYTLSAFNQANAAYVQANNARITANAALPNSTSSTVLAGNLHFSLSGSNTAPVITRAGTGNTTTGIFFPATRNTIAIVANTQYGVYVAPTGNVGVGSTNTSYRLHVTGDIYATGDITAFSDVIGKTDITTITNAMGIVNNLRGVRYTRRDNQQKKIGVIAQEVRDILPEVVVNADNNIGVSYQSMVAVLIEAVKELSAEVEKLKGK